MSIEKALAQLEARGVSNPPKLCGELLLSLIAPAVSKYDTERETRNIGPAILVTDLRRAVKTPAQKKRDAHLAYMKAQSKYRKWITELYDWPENCVIRACTKLERSGVKLSEQALKKELGPSPLDVL